MAYTDIAELAADADFLARVNAAYAVETLDDIANPNYVWPESWSQLHAWAMAAQPGYGAAYSYAKANHVQNPGKDTSVITDAQVTAGVQSILATTPSQPPAEPAE
jgi:hypothetical protein